MWDSDYLEPEGDCCLQEQVLKNREKSLASKDRILSGPEEVVSGFASHFESLARPADDP